MKVDSSTVSTDMERCGGTLRELHWTIIVARIRLQKDLDQSGDWVSPNNMAKIEFFLGEFGAAG